MKIYYVTRHSADSSRTQIIKMFTSSLVRDEWIQKAFEAGKEYFGVKDETAESFIQDVGFRLEEMMTEKEK